MARADQVYIDLQKHLNNQPVGFPATRSGVEIKILKHIFSPREAQIAACLTYRPEPLEVVFERAGHLVRSLEELEDLLDRIQKNGGIESKTKDNKKLYCNTPLVVGMYENQLGRLTPEFLRDFNQYTADINFGIEFLSTELPQMRTIPVARSILPQHHVSGFDEVAALLQKAEAPFVILECICRKKKALEGGSCRVTHRKETCLAMGGIARSILPRSGSREIDRETAMAIIEQNQKEGLVLQPANTERPDFICSCCGCCCGMLGFHRAVPKPLEFWTSNFQASVDIDACDGCGVCEKRCQVGAVRVSANKQPAAVDLNRCLGCGVCAPACPKKAITLFKKPLETRPPPTREDLYETILAKKKGKLGKLKLTAKLIADAVRTGQTNLLKR